MIDDLFIATDSGAVTVRRQGGAWSVVSTGLKGWAVTDVATAPDGRAFAATRGDGVWVTEDGGGKWLRPNRGKRGPGKVQSITVDPHNPDRLYAGGEPLALWTSEDAGETWREVESLWDVPSVPSIEYPVYAVEPHVRDIVVDPKDPRTIYAALQVGSMVKSTDGGNTWRLLDRDLDADVHTIVVRPDRPERLFVSTGGHDSRLGHAPGRALYESADGGETWLPMAMEFAQEYGVPLVLHEDKPDVLFAVVASGTPSTWRGKAEGANSLLIRSSDAGASWQVLETGYPEIQRDFPGAIAISPADADLVYVATRKGRVYQSENGGDSWSDLCVEVGPVMSLVVSPA